MHIAIATEGARVAEAKKRLEEEGKAYQEIGGNLYIPDPDGLTLELWAMD